MDWIEVILVLAFGAAAFYAGMHYGAPVKSAIGKVKDTLRRVKGAL